MAKKNVSRVRVGNIGDLCSRREAGRKNLQFIVRQAKI
jgi:hypothetical protein